MHKFTVGNTDKYTDTQVGTRIDTETVTQVHDIIEKDRYTNLSIKI